MGFSEFLLIAGLVAVLACVAFVVRRNARVYAATVPPQRDPGNVDMHRDSEFFDLEGN